MLLSPVRADGHGGDSGVVGGVHDEHAAAGVFGVTPV